MSLPTDEEDRLRSAALQTAQSIRIARQRAEEELLAAKEALELRSEELERANALIRTITENAASSLLMLDESGIVTYMNPAAIEETGYTLEEFSRGPFHEILHPASDRAGHPAESCPIKDAREQMRPLRKQRDIFVRKDGSKFPVSCSLSPLQREGRAVGAVLEFRDITEEQLAHRALEESNHRKDEFLATLSHELRTPMTAVLGWARMLKLGLEEEEAVQAIDAIEKSAVIQAQLIDDVLDVSRTVAGKMTFAATPVDLSPVLRAAMSTIHPAASAKGIEVVANVPPRLPSVLGDEGRLQQIIWNLLSNAVKFTPRGGKITIRQEHDGSLLRLIVQDTGKGIDPAYLPHVFEPFSQENASMTRSHEGIGVGLSIVRSLIELHGGRVRAWSEGLGKGATFTVDLPVLESSQAVESDELRSASSPTADRVEFEFPDFEGAHVLVVDDQALARDLIMAVFRRAGAEVEAASSVREALDRYHRRQPDMVVCDLAMPDEDGFAFVRAVRALPSPSNQTPIIALTAFGRPEDRENALAGGFNSYLKKPVDPLELAQIAHELVIASKPGDEGH
ncbi:MAG: ATP-binding protein [Thermoanaerobaculia bacterium]